MMGIDLETLIVLAVLAFILFGPQKLPEYAAKLGRLVAKIRAASQEVTQEIQNPFQYPPEPKPSPRQVTGTAMCPACHETIRIDFTFCPKCGHRLEDEVPGAPPPQQPLAS